MNILCFGDSNTHGYNPTDGSRYDRNTRFTGILQAMLPNDYIIEEGLSGRTTVFNDPINKQLAGIDYITPCLSSHEPLDLVIVMLGTNDTKERFCASAEVINLGLISLIKEIRNNNVAFRNQKAEVLIIAPVPILDSISQNPFVLTMGELCSDKSKKIIPLFKQTAIDTNCFFLDPSTKIKCSEIDCVHLSTQAHQIMANLIYESIIDIKKKL